MTKRSVFTWIGLIVLTLVTGLVYMSTMNYSVILILLLSAMKFIGVAFEFMEIRAAHDFWKGALTVFLLFFIIIVYVLL